MQLADDRRPLRLTRGDLKSGGKVDDKALDLAVLQSLDRIAVGVVDPWGLGGPDLVHDRRIVGGPHLGAELELPNSSHGTRLGGSGAAQADYRLVHGVVGSGKVDSLAALGVDGELVEVVVECLGPRSDGVVERNPYPMDLRLGITELGGHGICNRVFEALPVGGIVACVPGLIKRVVGAQGQHAVVKGLQFRRRTGRSQGAAGGYGGGLGRCAGRRPACREKDRTRGGQESELSVHENAPIRRFPATQPGDHQCPPSRRRPSTGLRLGCGSGERGEVGQLEPALCIAGLWDVPTSVAGFLCERDEDGHSPVRKTRQRQRGEVDVGLSNPLPGGSDIGCDPLDPAATEEVGDRGRCHRLTACQRHEGAPAQPFDETGATRPPLGRRQDHGVDLLAQYGGGLLTGLVDGVDVGLADHDYIYVSRRARLTS